MRRGDRERWSGGEGAISNLEYNLIIMPMPLKMSRLPWESIISKAIMSFMAHKEKGRGATAAPFLRSNSGSVYWKTEESGCVCLSQRESDKRGKLHSNQALHSISQT